MTQHSSPSPVEVNATPSATTCSSKLFHVAQGWVDLIKILVRDLNNRKDAQDQYQFTPLHSAANGGHVGAIRTLLDFNHAVDMRDHQGAVPLGHLKSRAFLHASLALSSRHKPTASGKHAALKVRECSMANKSSMLPDKLAYDAELGNQVCPQ